MATSTPRSGDFQYSFRLSPFRRQATYRLTDRALTWTEGDQHGELAYSDIRGIRIHDGVGLQQYPTFRRCIITPTQGPALTLSSNHFRNFIILFDSQLRAYQPFIDELLRRIAATNPNVEYYIGYRLAFWLIAVAVEALFLVSFAMSAWLASMFWLREHDPPPAIACALLAIAWLALALFYGPWVRRNRLRPYDPHTESPLPPLKLPPLKV
jgi:hypothetical protein